MAVSEIARRDDPFVNILDSVARAIGRHGIKRGEAGGAKAALRVTREQDVRRTVQVYWTAFEAAIPDTSIGLHLEVAEPRVHWAEAYLTPRHRNWVFIFAENEAGEIQLVYHGDYPTPQEAIDMFFDLATWYVLTATDNTWDGVVYSVEDGLTWSTSQQTYADATSSSAIQESLKKSTILWLRWRTGGRSQTMPVWYLFDQKVGKIYVLSGERQQTIPGARQMQKCTVILRWKGRNSSVAEIPASVRVIKGSDLDWTEIADRIAEKRLNIPGLPEDTARRWRDECVILELTLRG
jgi:hypothetical protein